MAHRNADTGSYEAVGSQKWIIKTIAVLAALALGWAGSSVLRRIDKLETAVAAHEKELSKIDRLSDKLDGHSHPQDAAIADLKRRMDRVEYPRPWERQTPHR